jgi:hypothetical protein
VCGRCEVATYCSEGHRSKDMLWRGGDVGRSEERPNLSVNNDAAKGILAGEVDALARAWIRINEDETIKRSAEESDSDVRVVLSRLAMMRHTSGVWVVIHQSPRANTTQRRE